MVLSARDRIPDHSVVCRARHERFRENDALRRVLSAPQPIAAHPRAPHTITITSVEMYGTRTQSAIAQHRNKVSTAKRPQPRKQRDAVRNAKRISNPHHLIRGSILSVRFILAPLACCGTLMRDYRPSRRSRYAALGCGNPSLILRGLRTCAAVILAAMRFIDGLDPRCRKRTIMVLVVFARRRFEPRRGWSYAGMATSSAGAC